MTADELARTMRAAIASGSLELPALGGGASPQRLAGLSAIGRADLTLARVAEAHVGAVQVLREAGRCAAEGCWYAVWAAEDPSSGLRLRRERGRLVLEGTKPFCSGAGLVDRALVTARTEASPRPLLLDVAALQVRQSVERTCSAILDRFGRALGPRPLAFDAAQMRRVGELTLYLRQCHAERDVAALGAELRTAAS